MPSDEQDLALAPDEMLAEHGVRGAEPLGPEDRIGPAVALLGSIRKTLYGERPDLQLEHLQAFEARERLRAAQPILTRLWVELVSIENALVPLTEGES